MGNIGYSSRRAHHMVSGIKAIITAKPFKSVNRDWISVRR